MANTDSSLQAVTLAGSASGQSLHLRNSMGFTAHGERHQHPRLAGTFPSQRWPTQTSLPCSSPRPSGQCCAPPTARSPRRPRSRHRSLLFPSSSSGLSLPVTRRECLEDHEGMAILLLLFFWVVLVVICALL